MAEKEKTQKTLEEVMGVAKDLSKLSDSEFAWVKGVIFGILGSKGLSA